MGYNIYIADDYLDYIPIYVASKEDNSLLDFEDMEDEELEEYNFQEISDFCLAVCSSIDQYNPWYICRDGYTICIKYNFMEKNYSYQDDLIEVLDKLKTGFVSPKTGEVIKVFAHGYLHYRTDHGNYGLLVVKRNKLTVIDHDPPIMSMLDE